MLEFQIQNFKRHIKETLPLINQLSNEVLQEDVVSTGRNLGEVILHMIRSFEYYSVGLSSNTWKISSYSLNDYNNSDKIKNLFEKVCDESLSRILTLTDEDLKTELSFNRKATKLEILQEMMEHSITHRGQILVYYRLLGIEPVKIDYII